MRGLAERKLIRPLTWCVDGQEYRHPRGGVVYEIPPQRQTAEQRQAIASMRSRGGTFGTRDAVVIVAPWSDDRWTTAPRSAFEKANNA